jgi:hypothetical protein
MSSDSIIALAASRLKKAFSTYDRIIIGTLFVIGVITRWMAIPASLWEWDDILFAKSLHNFSVPEHSPHPPGFPVFVVLARIIHGVTLDEHVALTTLAFLFSIFLLPTLYLFFQEIFANRHIALAGSMLCGFSPSVWAISCQGRSDGPALVSGLIAATLLLQGRKSLPALWAGCVALGLGAGLRVTVAAAATPFLTYVLIGYVRRGNWKVVGKAISLVGLCVLIWYVPLIWHEGWANYQSAVKYHGDYIWRMDSLFAQGQNSHLSYRAYMYFGPIWGAKWIGTTIYCFATVGVIWLIKRRQWSVLGWLGGGLIPFMVFAYAMTTPYGAPYYSLPYIPLFTGLAAYGLVAPWHKPIIGTALAIILAITIGTWTQPIIKLLHKETSPSLQAVQYLKINMNQSKDLLVYDGFISPHVNHFFSHTRHSQSSGELPLSGNLIAPSLTFDKVFRLTENPPEIVGAENLQHFSWSYERGAKRLFPVSLQRYFDTYVYQQPVINEPIWGRGWWGKEGDRNMSWRWADPRSEVLLPPVAKEMKLRLAGIHSLSVSPANPATLTLRLNGQVIERFTITEATFDHTVKIKADPNYYWSALQIEADKFAVPSQLDAKSTDHRALSFRCTRLEWTPELNSQPLSLYNSDTTFGPGWYGIEHDDNGAWRWMSGESVTNLPALTVDGQVDLLISLPTQPDKGFPMLYATVNEKPLSPIQTEDGEFTRSFRVPFETHLGQTVKLKLTIKPVRGELDQRDFGLHVRHLSWRPLPLNEYMALPRIP